MLTFTTKEALKTNSLIDTEWQRTQHSSSGRPLGIELLESLHGPYSGPSVLADTFNTSTWEAEAGRTFEFEANLDYIEVLASEGYKVRLPSQIKNKIDLSI